MIGRSFALLLCSAVLLGGSVSASAQTPSKQSKPDIAKFGVYPIAYRELIERWLSDQLIDPGSAKIEWLTEPTRVEVKRPGEEPFYGWQVDFKVNSRNKFGMYTGKQARRCYIRNGGVVRGRVPR